MNEDNIYLDVSLRRFSKDEEQYTIRLVLPADDQTLRGLNFLIQEAQFKLESILLAMTSAPTAGLESFRSRQDVESRSARTVDTKRRVPSCTCNQCKLHAGTL